MKNPDYTSCIKKQKDLIDSFSNYSDAESTYKHIMDLGKSLSPIEEIHKVEKNIVKGCQSLMFLHSQESSGKLFFKVYSNALISAGLAALLINVYSGETAETILKCPPHFLTELKINQSLSPSRANGLSSLHLRMKQDAINFISKSLH